MNRRWTDADDRALTMHELRSFMACHTGLDPVGLTDDEVIVIFNGRIQRFATALRPLLDRLQNLGLDQTVHICQPLNTTWTLCDQAGDGVSAVYYNEYEYGYAAGPFCPACELVAKQHSAGGSEGGST